MIINYKEIHMVIPLLLRPVQEDHEEKDTEQYMLTVNHSGTYVHLDVNEDILCLIKEGKYITILTMKGDEYQLNDTMNALQERFENTRLYRINRSTFINTTTMLGFRTGEKPRTLEILLKPDYNALIALHRRDYLVVTGVNVPIIRQLFAVN